MFIVFLILNHFFPTMEVSPPVMAWFFLAMAFLPGLIFFISLFMPITRRVECLNCDWNQDFSILNTNLNLPK